MFDIPNVYVGRFFLNSIIKCLLEQFCFPLSSQLLDIGILCVFQCQTTRLLRASGSTQGGYMALSVVYFRITHRLGRPHYVWDEYLYSVLEKVQVRMTVCVTVCVV